MKFDYVELGVIMRALEGRRQMYRNWADGEEMAEMKHYWNERGEAMLKLIDGFEAMAFEFENVPGAFGFKAEVRR